MVLPCNPPNSLWYICRPGQGIVGCCAQFCPRRLELESILYWVSALLDEVCVVYAVDCQSALKVYKSPAPLWSIYWEQQPPIQISAYGPGLYQLYNSKCPRNRPDDAFYLKVLGKPQGDIWYTCMPVGHNLLSKTIPASSKQQDSKGRNARLKRSPAVENYISKTQGVCIYFH